MSDSKIKRYKFIKPFDGTMVYDADKPAETLKVGAVYKGTYVPINWLWDIQSCVSHFPTNFEIVNDDNNQAMRFNTGKPEYSLLDLKCFEDCVRVLEFGKNKYARDNWRIGLPQTQILDSMLRHIAALQRGELIDPESGISHIGHIQANAMFLGNDNNIMDIVENGHKNAKLK